MEKEDKRVKWKNKNELELILLLKEIIEKNDIRTVRSYQAFLSKTTCEVPSMWLIIKRFKSWDNLLLILGKTAYKRYQWNELSNKELEKLVKEFIQQENIRSQRMYEKKIIGENLPCFIYTKKTI